MTDNEIIKALEYCKNKDNDCMGCPTYKCCENDPCGMIGEVFDLINRKNAEKDKLEYILMGVMHSVDKWLEDDELKQDEANRAATMREKTLQIVEGKQEEIERLQSTNNRLKGEIEHILDNQVNLIKISKAEARKELGERLKEKAFRFTGNDYSTVLMDDIIELLEEAENE